VRKNRNFRKEENVVRGGKEEIQKSLFASYSSNKGLILRIYRDLKKLCLQRIYTPMKKWAYELNREFSKEEVQIAS
jgi:hypothetical protein